MENQRIAHMALDEKTNARCSPQVEHERKVAIYDLLEENFFSPIGGQLGPFHLHLSNVEGRLIFDVRDANDADLLSVRVPAKSFRRIIRDYFMVCETYFEAIKTKTPSQIETIDMGRRGLHNEGAEVLKERLAEHVEVDHHTARRLFTLICVLHIKG
jgi:uncharacterized protein (UPF0262 family)|tara:strand:+ start:87 stop:557 length:471 start_codon:yes stop_codon:yes gene_type:complete